MLMKTGSAWHCMETQAVCTEVMCHLQLVLRRGQSLLCSIVCLHAVIIIWSAPGVVSVRCSVLAQSEEVPQHF